MTDVTRARLRLLLGEGAKGKTIESLTWDEEGGYWVMKFTDGTETCWNRNMAETLPHDRA